MNTHERPVNKDNTFSPKKNSMAGLSLIIKRGQ